MENCETLEGKGRVVEAFSRALVRESHNLMQRPDLLWQQLYNRLQWEEKRVLAVLAPEFARRTAPGTTPWLRTRTPFRESKALIRTLQGHKDVVWDCAISPDGSFIVSASEDATLKVWDTYTGKERAILTGHAGGVTGCAVSPNGDFIVSASRDATLKVWDTRTATVRATIRCGSPLEDCAISPDGRTISSVDSLGSVALWNVGTWERKLSLHGLKVLYHGHRSPVHACAFSPDGRFIVSGGNDKQYPSWEPGRTVKVWYASTGQERGSYLVYEFPREPPAGFPYLVEELAVVDCAVSPDGCSVLSLSSSQQLQAWGLEGGKKLASTYANPDEAITGGFAISPDYSFIVSASKNWTLQMYDARTFEKTASIIGHTDAIEACAVSPDGSLIVSASRDRTLKIWDTDAVRDSSTTREERHIRPVTGCDVRPDGSSVVSISMDNHLIVWNHHTRANKVIQERGDWFPTVHDYASEYPMAGCAWSPDGSFIVATLHMTKGEHSVLRVWDSHSLKQRATLEGHKHYVDDCAIAPDGSSIVSARVLRHGTIAALAQHLKVWDTHTFKERASLIGHTDVIKGFAISPDSSFIVSASRDKSLKVWDAKTDKELAALQGHTSGVSACAVSPDGSFILSASHDKTLRVWDVKTYKERATIPLPGNALCLALAGTLAAVGDGGGNVHILNMFIEYGPAIVTATDCGQGYVVRCPGCLELIPLQKESLGRETTCPREGCGTEMKVNPFVAGRRKEKWWPFWKR